MHGIASAFHASQWHANPLPRHWESSSYCTCSMQGIASLCSQWQVNRYCCPSLRASNASAAISYIERIKLLFFSHGWDCFGNKFPRNDGYGAHVIASEWNERGNLLHEKLTTCYSKKSLLIRSIMCLMFFRVEKKLYLKRVIFSSILLGSSSTAY